VQRSQKETLVAALRSALDTSELVVVTHQKGLTVAESTSLRCATRETGVTFKVAKNTLVKLAVKDTSHDCLTDYLSGPTALAYSADPVAAAKTISNFAKDNENLEILGGCLSGQLLDKSGVEALAKLPSLDELRAKILATIAAPATQLTRVVQTPATQLVQVVRSHSEQA
jgi:large subunit ribosomal protein L10